MGEQLGSELESRENPRKAATPDIETEFHEEINYVIPYSLSNPHILTSLSYI